LKTSIFYLGDCLSVLKRFVPDKSVDLIYADPPFFSNRQYDVTQNNGIKVKAYTDKWEDINVYIEWMKERLWQCYRVLKDTGSIYLHCDWHASHRLRIVLEEIFGVKNFRNEVIWSYHWGIHTNKQWNRKHDSILFYSKSSKWQFNADTVREPYSKTSKMTQDPQWNKSYNPNGRLPEDVWYIPTINAIAKERVGYPTQKPEALLERIVKASSNEGDIVLDPFCGCGTTLAVTYQLNRKWIGIDVSPVAFEFTKHRLKKIGATGTLRRCSDNNGDE